MSRNVAFFIITLPFQSEYEAFKAATPDAGNPEWQAYTSLCDRACIEISSALHFRLHTLGLKRAQIPKLAGMAEFDEPFLFIRQVCPEAAEKLLTLGELAGYKLTPVYY